MSNNICVIVPLRSSQAQILLGPTIGRGLRLMWRGDDRIDELKRETRERFRSKQEPTNYFDVLFIVDIRRSPSSTMNFLPRDWRAKSTRRAMM